MNVHVSYKVSKTPDLEKEFNQQIEKINRRLQVFRPELVHLHAGITQNSAREGFSVSLNLRLPSGQLAVNQSGPDARAAVKGAFNDLTEQLTRHKDLLRNHHKWPRHRRDGWAQPESQVPFEQTIAAVQPETVSDADVAGYINANLTRLSRYVERELLYRENSGVLRPDQLSVEEVIDEAVSKALDGSIEKPERLALEPWLYRLAARAIPDLAARSDDAVPSIPLEQAAPRRDPHRQSGTDEAHLQYHQPDEAMANRDLIPDRRLATPEASAASDEMITLVEAALMGARGEDREAFLLFAIEGFTPEEIAAISERSPEQVRQSVSNAREFLRKAIPVPGAFKDKLLQHSKIA